MTTKITVTHCCIALSLAIFQANAMLQTTTPERAPNLQTVMIIRGACLTEKQAQSALQLIDQIIECLNMPIEYFGDHNNLASARTHQNDCVAPYYEHVKNLFKLEIGKNADKNLDVLQTLQSELQFALGNED